MKLRFGRRRFLRGTFSGLGAFIAARVGWLFPEGRQVLARARRAVQENVALQPPVEGELYAGFVLLPEGAPVPSFVKYPELGIPIVCGVGVGRGGPEPTAVSQSYDTAESLAKEVNFPVYTFNKLSDGLQPNGASLIGHETGEVFTTSIMFQSYNREVGRWETTVSIWAQPDFPKPFPLWSSEPVEPGGPAVVPEKVNFLPVPGVMVAAHEGYVFHWIQNDVFYTLIAEQGLSLEDAKALVAALAVFG